MQGSKYIPPACHEYVLLFWHECEYLTSNAVTLRYMKTEEFEVKWTRAAKKGIVSDVCASFAGKAASLRRFYDL